jgi:4-hydroxy-tetrahydrodipicolinate synthase
MSKPIFEGSGVAIVTPFMQGGVNYKKLEQIVDFHLQKGSDAIIVCGSTGEASTMPDSEHIKVVKCVVDAVAGRIPVIAGAGSNDTNHGVQLTKEVCDVGADAALLVTPYYNKCTPEGLFRHYKAMATSCDIPILLYNVPSRTNVNISVEVMKRIADCSECDNIIGVKECNINNVPDVLHECGDRFTIYSGEDGLVLPLLSLGAKGVISVAANILPTQISTMVHDYLNGNTAKALEMQIHIMPLINALFSEVNPIPVKEALNILGQEVGPCRLPLCEMSAKNHDNLVKVLNSYNSDMSL